MTLRYEVRMENRGSGDTAGTFDSLETAKLVMGEVVSKGSTWARIYDLHTGMNVLEIENPSGIILVWSNKDPRHYFNKRGKIVIVRPSSKGHGHLETSFAEVDCKDTWSIQTDFEGNSKWITADDKWDTSWSWILWPK